MTPASVLRDIAAFWVQIACVVAVIAAFLKIVPVPARARYISLRLALVACLVVPWLFRATFVVPSPAAPGRATVDVAPITMETGESALMSASAPARAWPDIPWARLLLALLAFGMIARGAWLVVGFKRLQWLNGRAVPVDSPDYAAAQEQLGTSATIAQVDRLAQPVTFGFRRPVVLLPEAMDGAPAALRRAVVTHELFHVRRGDWLSLLAEEAVRTTLWFHPAILWLTSQIQLAREELVDELTVQATGDRRAYIQALLAFADSGGPQPLDWARGGPAPAFARRRQLFHRIVSVSKERVMSAPRILMSIAALSAAVVGASWYASALFPIVTVARADELLPETTARIEVQSKGADEPVVAGAPEPRMPRAVVLMNQRTGEVIAVRPVTPENPIPRRTRGVSPAAQSPPGIDINVSARVTIDRDGRVFEVALDGCSISKDVCRELFEAAAAAIRQWRYERPEQAPLQFYVVTTFRRGQEPAVTQSATEWNAFVRQSDGLASLRETPDRLRALAEESRQNLQREGTEAFLRERLAELTAKTRELERAQRLAIERGPANPDLAMVQQALARLSTEMAALQRKLVSAQQERAVPAGAAADQLREAARNQEQLRAEVEVALARLREVEQRLQEYRAQAELASRRTPESTPTATVKPTPTTPFDGSRQLVSPSGRAPVRVGGAPIDMLPVPTKRVQPAYSREAMEARLQGTVAVEVLVDERGRVADARVLRSIPLLDEAALTAARQWEFTPSLVNGEPVPVLLMMEMNFAFK